MRYVGNSFSLQMLDSSDCTFKVTACEAPKPSKNIHSIFGHSDIAAIAGYPVSRETVKLKKGDILYVLQLVSGRLAEGVTTLPESCKLKWMKVEIL